MPNYLTRGGTYYRVADKAWAEPLDPSYSKVRGGRWNARGSHAVLYLTPDVSVAIAITRNRFAREPFGIEALDPATAPSLLELDLPEEPYLDVMSPKALVEAGLPATYPLQEDGSTVGWELTQPIGAEAFARGDLGIVCTTATRGHNGEELAWFDQPGRKPPRRRATIAFQNWFK